MLSCSNAQAGTGPPLTITVLTRQHRYWCQQLCADKLVFSCQHACTLLVQPCAQDRWSGARAAGVSSACIQHKDVCCAVAWAGGKAGAAGKGAGGAMGPPASKTPAAFKTPAATKAVSVQQPVSQEVRAPCCQAGCVVAVLCMAAPPGFHIRAELKLLLGGFF